MLDIIQLVLFVLGIILLIVGFVTFRRKSESEISKEVLRTPMVICGVIILVIDFIIKIVSLVM